MLDCYEWFDPHQARSAAAAAPMKEREAFNRGLGAGQAEVRQLLGSEVFTAFKMASEQLGRQLAHRPEVTQAVGIVADGLRQNSEFRVVFEERPRDCAKVIIQEVDVRPFRLNYAIQLDHEDLMRRRF